MPDMSIVPTKYHTYISPPLRPVFLDALEDNSRAVIENLNAEIAALKGRVASLERDNDFFAISAYQRRARLQASRLTNALRAQTEPQR
jgi:hypothetical protein